MKWMKMALRLARQQLGRVAPNPAVGAVLVRGDRLLGYGVTADGGRPHAEQFLEDCKIEDSDVLYVTLEPCSHQGETPPCAEAIIKSGLKKISIATSDDDKRVNGRGIAMLQAAGVAVDFGLCEAEAREVNRGFFMRNSPAARPFVTLKLAISIDGRLIDPNESWITNEEARRFCQYFRLVNDAIMVGAGTIRSDNPMLSLRLRGLEKYSPTPIVIGRDIRCLLGSKILDRSSYFITTGTASDLKAVHTITCKEDACGLVDMREALQLIATKGCNNLLVEGGEELAHSLLTLDLVDELIIMSGNKFIGDFPLSKKFNLNKSREICGNLATSWRR